jgi:uncharacterized protein YceK
MKFYKLISMMLFLLTITSCGTSLNLKNVGHVHDAGNSYPFGGVYLDARYGHLEPVLYVDLPFSLVGGVIPECCG